VDLQSKQFDSLKDRDEAIKLLAIYQYSFRREKLIADEITKRYRRLMRVLHEDYLRQVLDAAGFEQVLGMTVLRELSSLCGDARRYLDRRRALESALEEMVAAELDFARLVRGRRLELIRRLLR